MDQVWLVFGETASGDELSGVFADAEGAEAHAKEIANRFEMGVKYTALPVPYRITDSSVELRMEGSP